MVSPPSQRLWVGMLAVMLAVVVEFPGAQQKCIFDEVQAQNGVVRAAPVHPDGPPTLRAQAGQQTNNPRWRASPLQGLSERHRRSLRKIPPPTPTPTSPQPIRIRSWIPKDSNNLSEAEEERVVAAVEEAVRMVSSLLSGNKTEHTHTHSEMYNNELLTFNSGQRDGSIAAQQRHQQILQVPLEEFKYCQLQQVCIYRVCVCVCVCVASAHETHSFGLFCFRLLLDKWKENIQNTHVRVYFTDLNECPFHYRASFSDFYRKLNTNIFLNVTK